MNASTREIPIRHIIDHSGGKIGEVIGIPTKTWRLARKYSVNNTLPIAAVNAWLQFSLAYVAAIIITHNDLSFITAVFNPSLMSAYALVSVILGTILLTSLILKNANKKEIKDENSIDGEIGTYQEEGKPYSEIAQEAEKIEIVTNLGSKGTKFSIIFPISKTQREILEGQKEENRNKVILLTIPCVISAAIIVGALVQNRFSFTNVLGWEEWVFISLVGAIAIAGICIMLSKLRNNTISKDHKAVKRFDNLDIIFHWLPRWLPFSLGKSSIVSVMEKKGKDQEGNDLQSQIVEIMRELKDGVVDLLGSKLDKICNSFDTFLDETKTLIDKKLIETADANIKETLNGIGKNIKDTLAHLKGIREDIKKDLDELHGEISIVLNDAKKFTKKVNSLDIEGIFSRVQNSIKNFDDGIKTLKDKVERLKLSRFGIPYLDDTQSNQDGHESGNNQTEGDGNEFLGMLKKPREEIDELQKTFEEYKKSLKDEFAELKKSLEEAKQNRLNEPDSSIGSESSSNDSLNAQLDEEKKAREENKLLKSIKRTEELKKENAELKEKFARQKETEEWEEKINGPASKLFDSVLESIEIEIVDPSGAKTKTTLRETGGEIKTNYRNGEEKTCPIKGSLKITSGKVISFLDPNNQEAWKMAGGGKSR